VGDPPLRIEDLFSALRDLAYNLRWNWERPTADLFRTLAPAVWDATHNPVAVLRTVAGDPDALAVHARRIVAAKTDLDLYLAGAPRLGDTPRVAYFSAEFAVTECLPIYSGGLGVLAGDHLKAASDLGLPLVGVGLLYGHGYFQQVIDENGQQEQYDRLDPDGLPLQPVLAPDGSPLLVAVPFPGRTVRARAWRAQVGRVPLYLLDTDLPENREDDRWITGHLYGGDQDTRIRQELVLGIGGVRLLRALGPEAAADVYHMNEGHSAFLVLELARERLEAGLADDFTAAVAQDASRLVFTTHTPVEAGHDAFPPELIEAYLGDYYRRLGLTHGQFMAFGRRDPDAWWEHFSMTVLALRGAARRNGVSRLHAAVSRYTWSGVDVSLQETAPKVEMGAITNGVHTATWVGPEMGAIFDRWTGRDWRAAPQDPQNWRGVGDAAKEDLWAARTAQRARLLERADALARATGGTGLAPEATAGRTLVLGFARRFATYKRAALLLSDPDRLARLLGDPARPIVLLFAGKAHPQDAPGKALLQRLVQAAREERFRGRILFLEGYDVELARLLVQGSDVWLNTPRRLEEASGTSGMKATLNGALHLSELDGWWDEAHRPELGWALGAGLPDELVGEARDQAEARELFEILEREVVPVFFARSGAGYPAAWLARVARSIGALAPAFSAHRMVAEYAEHMYLPGAATEPEQFTPSPRRWSAETLDSEVGLSVRRG
jgi:starch phosphorylase